MKKILVTGGAGYIGSHTVVDLIEHGYEVISVDNYCRSDARMLLGIEAITGKKITNYAIDLCSLTDTRKVFEENPDLVGIIHFAAYKAVGESVEQPLLYFENNLQSLINLLKCVQEFRIPNFVFSSSCTVYGEPEKIPVTEATPLQPATSPYGLTKQTGEQMLEAFVKTNSCSVLLLRYFNPAGAHPTAQIGELPIGRPQNLVPAITQTAIGVIDHLQVHGTDYSTRDGSCIRDFIHVCDLAQAHTQGIQLLEKEGTSNHCKPINLGSGTGMTVLECIHAFEKVSGAKLNWSVGPRRPGDVIAIYANNEKAKTLLGWEARYGIDDIMATAWAWEQRYRSGQTVLGS
ncbi:MAG: UDP-glucose 4-epimerase GalE [Bacteroidetes bacterium]|nr:UDP-glucose 4-epimerase GalE [Bacteroidota bacterium]